MESHGEKCSIWRSNAMDCGSNRAEVSIGSEEVGVELCVTTGSQHRVVMSEIASQRE